jgi:hypothetical protein
VIYINHNFPLFVGGHTFRCSTSYHGDGASFTELLLCDETIVCGTNSTYPWLCYLFGGAGGVGQDAACDILHAGSCYRPHILGSNNFIKIIEAP